jgi:site-specific recombinase XerD
MTRVKDKVLFSLVHDFFKVYLTKMTNRSPNTVYAYRESLDALLDFVKAEKKISLSKVTFEMIDRHMLTKFLDSLEAKGCSITTRNHRLNRIRAFYKYAAKMELTAVIHQDEILKVPLKTTEKSDIIEYMSEDAVKSILAAPDTKTPKGLRDQFLMVLLYDTGARIQEIMGMRVRDIRKGKKPTVTIHHGKGGKTRTVPILRSTLEQFEHYVRVFHPAVNEYSDEFLFYVVQHGQKNQMHHDTARRFIKTYGEAAKKICSDVPENVHPHLWRHTRAMHLYQHGIDLTLISQWLGHAKYETTLIYAKADTEHKRRAMEAANKSGPLSGKINSDRFVVNDDEMIKKLYGLK